MKQHVLTWIMKHAHLFLEVDHEADIQYPFSPSFRVSQIRYKRKYNQRGLANIMKPSARYHDQTSVALSVQSALGAAVGIR